MKQLYCLDCHGWYDRKLGRCPMCGSCKPGFNKSLYTASVNKSLYSNIENAERNASP